MQQYQWGVKLTIEYSNGSGVWNAEKPEVRPCSSEREATARFEAAMDSIAHYAVRRPTHQRIVAAELVKRPVSEWETVTSV